MNEEQKKYLASLRKELTNEQCFRINAGIIDELEFTAKELMKDMNVLDVVQERNKPRIQLLAVLTNMAQALHDIIEADLTDENENK